MDQLEDRLAQAFEALSAATPDDAPPAVEANLKAALRRHHVRRRRQRQAIGAAVFLTFVIVAAFITLRSRLPKVRPETIIATGTREEPLPAPSRSPNEVPPVKPERNRNVIAKSNRQIRAQRTWSASKSNFVTLPSYTAAFSNGDVRMVRVGLTNTDLYQMGAPQLGTPGAGRTVADVLLDRDGIPIAVRRIGK